MKLMKLRKKIDKTDKKIAKLLNRRFLLIEQVKEVKKTHNYPISDALREKEVIDKNIIFIEPKYKIQYMDIYQSIFKNSKDQQQ